MRRGFWVERSHVDAVSEDKDGGKNEEEEGALLPQVVNVCTDAPFSPRSYTEVRASKDDQGGGRSKAQVTCGEHTHCQLEISSTSSIGKKKYLSLTLSPSFKDMGMVYIR